ncbi:MAG: hypothetical protein CVU84_05235 [Firmicutes bacterium HGW-Firmicutes-1]|jgi:hypothetical protein|nr:MAG: hypothetical protein CVU84_05235 [Firmicutes bacterium HGW-Firmicutes-1]
MDLKEKHTLQPMKKYAAVCGLFCPSCTIFIGTHDDPERLKNLAESNGVNPDEFSCEGCHSENKTGHCKTCKIIECASMKGIEFCVECKDYPCYVIDEFQAVLPHRIEVHDSQATIKEIGFEKWFEKMTGHYACDACNAINSAYDMHCRVCGNSPGNEYVRRNVDEMLERF